MKIFRLSLIATIMLCSLATFGADYKISGNVKGLTGWVYMRFDNDKVDSTRVSNGQFIFSGSVERLGFARIYNDKGMFVPVVPDGCSITISGDIADVRQIKLSGSPLTQKVLSVRDTLERGLERIRNEVTSKEHRDSMFATWVKDEFMPTVTENADNLAGVMAVADNRFHLSLDERIQCFSLLSAPMQENTIVKRLLAITKQQMLTTEGKPYIDIQMTDSTGREVCLSEVVGKGRYVLIDFWASWCRPCIEAIPELKTIYDKYNDKGFEIFGVSLDNDRDRWLKAIKKHGLNWWHVSDLKGWECEGAQLYGVEAIPVTLLINPDGVISKKKPSAKEIEMILSEGLSK